MAHTVTSASPDWKSTVDQAKRELILDAALRVFGARGFDAPTMDDVAAEADYSRRSLYRFFPAKDDLGAALALRCCRLLVRSLAPVGSLRLIDLVLAYERFSREHPREFRLILDTRQMMGSGRPLPMEAEWSAEDGAMEELLRARLGSGGGEPLAAALGYVEFRFRYRKIWETAGLAGSDSAMHSVLHTLLGDS